MNVEAAGGGPIRGEELSLSMQVRVRRAASSRLSQSDVREEDRIEVILQHCFIPPSVCFMIHHINDFYDMLYHFYTLSCNGIFILFLCMFV